MNMSHKLFYEQNNFRRFNRFWEKNIIVQLLPSMKQLY
jgi:hypothetical protein